MRAEGNSNIHIFIEPRIVSVGAWPLAPNKRRAPSERVSLVRSPFGRAFAKQLRRCCRLADDLLLSIVVTIMKFPHAQPNNLLPSSRYLGISAIVDFNENMVSHKIQFESSAQLKARVPKSHTPKNHMSTSASLPKELIRLTTKDHQ